MGIVNHSAVTSNVEMGPKAISAGPDDRALAFLPSAHIAQRIAIEAGRATQFLNREVDLVGHQKIQPEDVVWGLARPTPVDPVTVAQLVPLPGLADREAGEKRYQLEAHIGEPGKAAYLKGLQVTLGENQAFYVGGQSFQGGTLFLELVVLP